MIASTRQVAGRLRKAACLAISSLLLSGGFADAQQQNKVSVSGACANAQSMARSYNGIRTEVIALEQRLAMARRMQSADQTSIQADLASLRGFEASALARLRRAQDCQAGGSRDSGPALAGQAAIVGDPSEPGVVGMQIPVLPPLPLAAGGPTPGRSLGTVPDPSVTPALRSHSSPPVMSLAESVGALFGGTPTPKSALVP